MTFESMQSILMKIDYYGLFKIITGVIAFFVAYLKLLPLIPKSSNKIKSDIEVYKSAKDNGIDNYEIVKEAIEREIRQK